MKVIQSILTNNDCYKAGRKIAVKGLMLHSVGCPQPSAMVFVKNWNRTDLQVCVHGFIDANTGDVYQTLPWDYRGWHGGGSSNNTHIGVEMCEPSCIKYTGGANFTCSDVAAARAAATRTYESAVQLFAELCRTLNLDPLGDGVIISHEEGHRRGIASGHADPVHLWKQLGMTYTMDGFRQAVKAAMVGGGVLQQTQPTASGTPITGRAQATADQMRAYLYAKNPEARNFGIDLIPIYLAEGAAEGIRGDVAFAQSCLETGNFTFKGSAVTLKQNNFCGMGVTSNGMKGNSFTTPHDGIRAQIQHLKAYANKEPLANPAIDPRFKYVARGCAEFVEWLGIQENPQGKGWAAGAGYGEKILKILAAITGTQAAASTPTPAPEKASGFPAVPFKVKVIVPDLNIRTSPGSDSGKNLTGKVTGLGAFTIVEVSGSWGLLKSYQEKRNGWIFLGNPDYCKPL